MLLHGLLHQETYLRNSCLQTLQVCNFSLTESANYNNWSTALRFDGSRLVPRPLDCLSRRRRTKRSFGATCVGRQRLGCARNVFARIAWFSWCEGLPDWSWDTANRVAEHENAFVRTSSPAAIAEAVESWPQSVQPVLSTLQDFYRDKVRSSQRLFATKLTGCRPRSWHLSSMTMCVKPCCYSFPASECLTREW